MFNIKLEEKSRKMSFKALAVKIQQSKNRQALWFFDTLCPPPPPPRWQLGLNKKNPLIFWMSPKVLWKFICGTELDPVFRPAKFLHYRQFIIKAAERSNIQYGWLSLHQIFSYLDRKWKFMTMIWKFGFSKPRSFLLNS